MTLESPIQAQAIRWIRQNGGKAIKIKQGEGEPDLLVGWKGKLYLIEMKRPRGGRVSLLQKAIHEQWAKSGVTVHVARSVEDVIAILEGGE